MEKKKETTTTVDHATLSEAILAIMEDVDYIQKTGKGEGIKYKFATVEQIIHEVRNAALKHKVRISMGYSDAVELSAGETKSGNAMYRVRVKGCVTLAHKSEVESYSYWGEGADTGDKGTAKAQTSCLKQALRQLFLIETGEDDPDKEKPEGAETFEDVMKKLPKKTADEITDAFGWLKQRKFADLPKPSYRNAVMKVLEANENDPERILSYLQDQGWKGNVIASDMALEKMP